MPYGVTIYKFYIVIAPLQIFLHFFTDLLDLDDQLKILNCTLDLYKTENNVQYYILTKFGI